MVLRGDAGPQFVQSQEHRPTGPAKHGFCSPSTAVEVVQSYLGLKRPSLGPCQFLGRVLDGGNVRLLQFVHHVLPKTSASVPKPTLGKGNSKRESLVPTLSNPNREKFDKDGRPLLQ